MSYAEYGPRIFFSQANDAKLPVEIGDEFHESYSGCRLKLQDSYSDIRAWSLNQSDFSRYFRELTENEPMLDKNASKEHRLEDSLSPSEKELEILRRELSKYKSLKLTSEQKNELEESDNSSQDLWDVSTNDEWSLFKSFLRQFEKFKGYREALLERAFPGSFPKIDKMHKDNMTQQLDDDNQSWPTEHQSRADNDTETNRIVSQLSSSSIKLKTDKNNANEHSDINSNFHFQLNSNGIKEHEDGVGNINIVKDRDTAITEFEREHIMEATSIRIALENTIREKDAEIKSITDLNIELRSLLQKRDIEIDNLHEKFARTQSQLRGIAGQRSHEVDELKLKLSDGKILIDQLKRKLGEQRLQCNMQMSEIENYKYNTVYMEALRIERDTLARKLSEVLKNVNGIEVQESIETWIYERKALIDENQSLEIQCSEQEEEIDRLSKLIDCINRQNDDQCCEMQRTIENLQLEIDKKNEIIANGNCEKFMQGGEISDDDLDQTLGAYLKKKFENIKEFSVGLKDAWNYLEKKNLDIDNSQREMAENERISQEKMKEKCKELKYYCDKYEECKEIVEQKNLEINNSLKKVEENERIFQAKMKEMGDEIKYYRDKYEETKELVDKQIEEIQQLLQDNETSDTYNEKFVTNLMKINQELETKVSALHNENSDWMNKFENINCRFNELNHELITLQNDNEKLIHNINKMNMKLDEKDLKINALKEENSRIAQTLKNSGNQLASMITKSKSKLADEKVNSFSQSQKETDMDDKEKRVLKNMMGHLRDELDTYQKKNKRLEDNLTNTLNQKTSLETKISKIKEDIITLWKDYKDINIYSDGNLLHLQKKIGESIETLKKRFNLSDTNICHEKELIIHNYNGFENQDNSESNIESDSTAICELASEYADSNDEIKCKKHANKSLTEDNRDFISKLNTERTMCENRFEQLKQNKTICEDRNKVLKRLDENESKRITEIYQPLSTINDYKCNNNSNKNKEEIKRISASSYSDRIDTSLGKNIEDFSKVTERFNNNGSDNGHKKN
ncbi:hypothetical protein PV327_003627 [Microctonus hyperodae]|uniref:Uncharacterized protein n=1 Tax=Microctonus hyperodae TaxID=165561 RepID=A0AA39G4D0_MICHY|nr:hypothetical protein PV327_003627 [Microctonus hyperodae]